jgi:ankyrin repeat protein
VAFNRTTMVHLESRQNKIEILAGDGNIDDLKNLLEPTHTQLEINTALENAIAYSQIKTAEYLLSLGADISNYDYQGAYYAVHNNELEGLKFAIENGVDINVNDGMLLNTGVETAINTKSTELVKWLLDNGANSKLLTTQSLKLIDNFGTNDLKSLVKNAT